jgi:hypothetical protein
MASIAAHLMMSEAISGPNAMEKITIHDARARTFVTLSCIYSSCGQRAFLRTVYSRIQGERG